MNTNVIAFPTNRARCDAANKLGRQSLNVIPFPTPEELELTKTIRASRLFSTAETLWDMRPNSAQAIEMMLRLASDPQAGTYQAKAADWCLENCSVKVRDAEGRPLGSRGRRG